MFTFTSTGVIVDTTRRFRSRPITDDVPEIRGRKLTDPLYTVKVLEVEEDRIESYQLLVHIKNRRSGHVR